MRRAPPETDLPLLILSQATWHICSIATADYMTRAHRQPLFAPQRKKTLQSCILLLP